MATVETSLYWTTNEKCFSSDTFVEGVYVGCASVSLSIPHIPIVSPTHFPILSLCIFPSIAILWQHSMNVFSKYFSIYAMFISFCTQQRLLQYAIDSEDVHVLHLHVKRTVETWCAIVIVMPIPSVHIITPSKLFYIFATGLSSLLVYDLWPDVFALTVHCRMSKCKWNALCALIIIYMNTVNEMNHTDRRIFFFTAIYVQVRIVEYSIPKLAGAKKTNRISMSKKGVNKRNFVCQKIKDIVATQTILSQTNMLLAFIPTRTWVVGWLFPLKCLSWKMGFPRSSTKF